MNLITLFQSVGTIKNTQFNDNRLTRLTNGLALFNSELLMDSCQVTYSNLFLQTLTVNSGFLQVSRLSKLTLTNSMFTNCTALQAAVMSITGYSIALVRNVTVLAATADTVIDV